MDGTPNFSFIDLRYRSLPLLGVAFVSQCPIVPGNSFLYDFSVPGQAGMPFVASLHFPLSTCI